MPGANNEYWRQEEFDTVGINHVRDDGSYADAANWYFTEIGRASCRERV